VPHEGDRMEKKRSREESKSNARKKGNRLASTNRRVARRTVGNQQPAPIGSGAQEEETLKEERRGCKKREELVKWNLA